MNTHSVSAETRVLFDDTKPVVTARTGLLSGSRVRLRALTIRVTALNQPDGSVGITTHLAPTVESWVYNPDQLSPAQWRMLDLDESQMPVACRPEHDALVAAVHALHPGLRYADSPLSVRVEARLAGTQVPA